LKKQEVESFEEIIADIIEFDKFKSLDNELHHGISRYEHSMRVAKWTYTISKTIRFNVKDTTRAALLHDFYLDKEFPGIASPIVLKDHPYQALENAKKYFDINYKQENMIVSHMFPVGTEKPQYKESWLLTAVDKSVSAYEMCRFKVSLVLGTWSLFFFNFITNQK